ncbi:MAG: hypothetical protein IPJ41_13565 [Phycisphaerales bacterium]|nr:hypothetical protein [Phycisphaerales bacterium]
MLKILRKHNKVILVVGGTLLLVAFLVPQAIRQVGKAKLGKSIGTMDGHKVSAAHWDESSRELTALRTFFQDLPRGELPLALEKGHEAEHWLLLATEAENAGMVGGSNEGASLLPIMAEETVRSAYQQQYRQYADMVIQNQPDQYKQAVSNMQMRMAMARSKAAGAGRLTLDEFDAALARLRGVFRMLDTYSSAERLSAQQAALLAKEQADSVLIDAAFLPARRLMDETLTPPPEELRALFEKNKSFKPGEGEYGLGYKLPPRVKVEWIELNRGAIEGVLKISLVDINKHWNLNRDRFPGPIDSEKAKIEAELKGALADRIMGEAESVIRAEIATTTRPLEKDGDYRKLPENWAQVRPNYVQIADRIVETVREAEKVSIPTPAVYARDNSWLDGAMLSKLPGIGAAQVRFGQQTITFPQAAMCVRELAGNSVLLTQVGLTPQDLAATSRDGNKYFYRVLAAAAESEPESIRDLLDPEAITTDWRAVKEYEVLAGSASEFASRVVTEGIDKFAESFGELVPKEIPLGETEAKPQARVSVSKNARVLQDRTDGLGSAAENDPEVISQIRAKASGISPITPIETVPLTERVVVTALPKKLGFLVSQINGIEPLTRETLPSWADYAVRMHQRDSFRGVGVPVPFRYDALKLRHKFAIKSLRGDSGKDAPEEG